MFVATGLSLLSLTATMCIRLLWWNSKWHFIETLIKIDHKIISYALDGFFGVLDGREKKMDTLRIQRSNYRQLQMKRMEGKLKESFKALPQVSKSTQ